MVDWTEQDKATRSRLERQSSGGQRLNAAGVLNAIAAIHTAKEAPDGFVALNAIRKQQRLAGRSSSAHNAAHERFAKAVAEGFNRLHPKSASSAPVAASIIGEDDARSEGVGPDLSEAKRLLDAAGALASGDPRVRDYRPSGQPESIAAQFLLDAARALVAAVRAQTEREAAEDVVAGRIPLAGRR
jgi:hypothetical protein